MRVHYLEIVTPDVAGVCATGERTHGVRSGEPEGALGEARTAPLGGGGEIAHPPLELPGHGTFAICVRTGIQPGLWQV